MNKRCITTIITLMILALLACESATPPGPELLSTPFSSSGYNQEAAYAAAQATLVAGQSEIMALSHQATVVSLNMDQAVNVAAQATIDYNQRQLLELSIQGTAVSLGMAQAAATQQFIIEQTQMAANATAAAQSQAATTTAQSQAATAAAQSQSATATYSAYILNVTQTAQVQAILDAQAAGTAQARTTLTAYPLTATPEAAIQADIAQTRNERERRAWWEDFVVTPLKAFLLTLGVLLLIAGAVIAYRRLIPVLEFRLRNPRGNDTIRSLFPLKGMIVDLDPHQHQLTQQELRLLKQPQLPSGETPQVEIISSSEPSIINWITEAEQKLRIDGRNQP